MTLKCGLILGSFLNGSSAMSCVLNVIINTEKVAFTGKDH